MRQIEDVLNSDVGWRPQHERQGLALRYALVNISTDDETRESAWRALRPILECRRDAREAAIKALGHICKAQEDARDAAMDALRALDKSNMDDNEPCLHVLGKLIDGPKDARQKALQALAHVAEAREPVREQALKALKAIAHAQDETRNAALEALRVALEIDPRFRLRRTSDSLLRGAASLLELYPERALAATLLDLWAEMEVDALWHDWQRVGADIFKALQQYDAESPQHVKAEEEKE